LKSNTSAFGFGSIPLYVSSFLFYPVSVILKNEGSGSSVADASTSSA
jgi:hypothetical protein